MTAVRRSLRAHKLNERGQEAMASLQQDQQQQALLCQRLVAAFEASQERRIEALKRELAELEARREARNRAEEAAKARRRAMEALRKKRAARRVAEEARCAEESARRAYETLVRTDQILVDGALDFFSYGSLVAQRRLMRYSVDVFSVINGRYLVGRYLVDDEM